MVLPKVLSDVANLLGTLGLGRKEASYSDGYNMKPEALDKSLGCSPLCCIFIGSYRKICTLDFRNDIAPASATDIALIGRQGMKQRHIGHSEKPRDRDQSRQSP